MPPNLSVNDDEILTTVGNYLVALTGAEVIRTQGNRVPMPSGAFIAMTPLFMTRLSTNRHDTNATAETITTTEAVKYTLQIDCYGDDSSNWANLISLTWRDDYACSALATTCQPLTCDEPKQIPLVTGEQQYLERWIITASLQYDPSVVTDAIPFADDITVTLTPLFPEPYITWPYTRYFGVYAWIGTGNTIGAEWTTFDLIDSPSTYLPLPAPYLGEMAQ